MNSGVFCYMVVLNSKIVWVDLNSGTEMDLNSVFLRHRGEFCGLTPDISNQIKTTCINHVGDIIVSINTQKNK